MKHNDEDEHKEEDGESNVITVSEDSGVYAYGSAASDPFRPLPPGINARATTHQIETTSAKSVLEAR